jgi:hypothetical protein
MKICDHCGNKYHVETPNHGELIRGKAIMDFSEPTESASITYSLSTDIRNLDYKDLCLTCVKGAVITDMLNRKDLKKVMENFKNNAIDKEKDENA